MAPRSSTYVPDPPVSSSSEEEEEISSGDQEEEVHEQIQKTKKREPETAKAAVKEKAKSASESEFESESESESDDENVEPIASSKLMDLGTPSKSVKPKSKATTSTVVSKKGTTKRGSEVEKDAKNSKRAKKMMKESKSNGALDKSASESESESESETESEDDENVEPIASSKPMQGTPSKSVKPKSKASTSTVVSKKGTAKRSSEVEKDAKDSKRAKKMKESKSNGALDKSEDTKKPPFQRVWSEDDEVVLLKGMIDFGREKGVDPTKDMTAFYDFIIKSLNVDVDLKRFRDKIWKLKQKFENHAETVEKGRKTLSTQHDQTIFDLSKELWGWKVISGKSKPSRVKIESGGRVEKGEKEMENNVSSSEISMLYRGVGVSAMENFVIKRGLDMHEGAEKLEIEEKWAKLHMDELELFIKRNELIVGQAKCLLAGYKSV